jgi:hypothetical protein
MNSTTTRDRWLSGFKFAFREVMAFALLVASVLGFEFGLMFLADAGPFAVREPPMPKNLTAPSPLVFARTQTICFPVFTDEERGKLFEECTREQGEVSSGMGYVECWQGEPFEEGSDKLWTRKASDEQ